MPQFVYYSGLKSAHRNSLIASRPNQSPEKLFVAVDVKPSIPASIRLTLKNCVVIEFPPTVDASWLLSCIIGLN